MAQSTKQQIENELGNLRASIAEFESELRSQKRQKAFRAKYEAIRKSVDDLSHLLPDVTAVTSIETFFKTVGDGMVAAQQDLDRRSIEYSQGQTPPPLPNLFRIPKVSADIKFAMTKESSERFNVLIFSESELTRETQQNSVSFEIVAAPPPPEMFETAPAAIAVIGQLSERAAIRQELEDRQKSKSPVQQDIIEGILDDKNFERTVIIADTKGRRLLLTPTSSKPSDKAKGEDIFLEAIILYPAAEADKDDIATRSLTAAGTGRWNTVKMFLLGAAEQ
ncbi:MAG: hypothetical protein GY791_07020 [Alphaproteobacteria bacterium]|nr:hypothetical protein [Alphaproteobacteria bacterium]